MKALNFARMAPTARALKGCEAQLRRIADSLEMWLAYQGLHVVPHKPDASGDEPDVLYTSEEKDFEREWLEETGQKAKVVEE